MSDVSTVAAQQAAGGVTIPATPAPQPDPNTPPTDPGSGFPNAPTARTAPHLERPRDPLTGQFLSEEEVEARVREAMEKARQEERDKLYSRLEQNDELQQRVRQLEAERQSEREAREAEQRQVEEAAAAEAERRRLEEEEKLSAADLIAKRDKEWEERFTSLQQESAKKDAILEQERRLQSLEAYRASKLQTVADQIAPQFMDYIRGDTEAEIDQGIETAIRKTEEIFTEIQQAQQQRIQMMPGTRVTAPVGAGPLEGQEATKTFTLEEIKAMSPSEFAKYRTELHHAARQGGLYGS